MAKHKKTVAPKNNQPKDEEKPKSNLLSRLVGAFFWTTCGFVIVVVLVAPVIGKLFPGVMSEIVFMHRFYWPPFANFSDPASLNMPNTRSFKLTVEDGVEIGVWQVTPDHLVNVPNVDQKLKTQEEQVLIYLHGNTGSRASKHRVELYKTLASMGFHVFTMDYRGYADSSGYPTQTGVLTDALTVYQYVRLIAPKSKVTVWGHSLGSGVATLLAATLANDDQPLQGLVLECPFDNIRNAALYHPLSKFVNVLPWFSWVVLDGLEENGISFPSDQSIRFVKAPILILHSEDDFIVPYHLGEKLYAEARKGRKDVDVKFVSFPASMHYGHKFVCRDPGLPNIIRTFLKL